LESSGGITTRSRNSRVESIDLRILSRIMRTFDNLEIGSRNTSEVVHVDGGEESVGLCFSIACCSGRDLDVV
jgi:hypothetical protein